jgi:poly(3-hydroxybutyrate) depolymerase
MRRLTSFLLFLAAAVSAPVTAQMLPSIASVQDSYNRLKTTAKPDDSLKRDIDAIDRAVAEAIRFGRLGEARRLLAKGTALLKGTGWTDLDDFANSIVLRADRLIADPIRPLALRVEQIYGSTLTLTRPLGARVSLHRLLPADKVPPGQPLIGEMERDYGAFGEVARDLRESPWLADLDLSGTADGQHVVLASLMLDDRLLVSRGLVIEVHKNLDGRLQKLEAGSRVRTDLAEKYRPEILFPADRIRLVNRGVVEPGGFDVEAALGEAESTLSAITARRDPFAGRTGIFKRHYLMAESGEIMPYSLYVPTSYNGRKPFPLVVALHGSGASEESFFTGGQQRQVPTVAEERGFLVVAPLGYRVTGGYGRTTPTSSQDPQAVRRRELSETDVLRVIDLVRQAYKVDDDRISLLGHSMGAAGAWHLGAKFPERWAAIACVAGSGTPSSEDRMRNLPQFVVHGDADEVVPVDRSRAMVEEMKRLGIEHRYVEVRGGDHNSILERYIDEAFAFFEKYRRK